MHWARYLRETETVFQSKLSRGLREPDRETTNEVETQRMYGQTVHVAPRVIEVSLAPRAVAARVSRQTVVSLIT